jgi:hypothetical protein
MIKCNKCDKQCKNKAGYSMHIKTCNGDVDKKKAKPFHCPKCNRLLKIKHPGHVNACDGTGDLIKYRRKTNATGTGKDWLKGKKYIDVYGEVKANELRAIQAENAAGNTHWKDLNESRKQDIKRKLSDLMKQNHLNGKEYKCGRAPKLKYSSPTAGDVTLDGSWELRTAQWLDQMGYNWKRNTQRFPYINMRGDSATYCPDFWVSELNTFIEVKGHETELDACKWTQFTEPLIIWKKAKLVEMGILPH